jgi:hypothetical protein
LEGWCPIPTGDFGAHSASCPMPVALDISSFKGLQKSMIIGLAKEHVTDMFFFIYCYRKIEIFVL